jgi:hypothetical protein
VRYDASRWWERTECRETDSESPLCSSGGGSATARAVDIAVHCVSHYAVVAATLLQQPMCCNPRGNELLDGARPVTCRSVLMDGCWILGYP